MAKERSDVSCFQSKFGGGWISEAQFLAETMCGRLAAAEGGRLPDKFWNDKYWNKKFRLQLKHAHDLLAKYPIKCVLAALEHPDCRKVYSLGLKSVIEPLATRELRKVTQNETLKTAQPSAGKVPVIVEDIQINTNEKPRTPFGGKQTLLSKMRELEGDDG